MPRSDFTANLHSGRSQQELSLPIAGTPPSRVSRPSIAHDFTVVRANLRKHGRGLLRAPLPYRKVGLQQGQPQEIPRLPSKIVADDLLQQYLTYVHRRFPILHWPIFHAEYENVYREGSLRGMPRTWGAVFFTVLAMGTVHLADPRKLRDGKEYLTKATSMIDFWQDELSFDQAKFCFLLSTFLLEINAKSASLIWLGSAARIAQDIGLHAETGPWPIVEQEMRRRIWYSIYAFDR